MITYLFSPSTSCVGSHALSWPTPAQSPTSPWSHSDTLCWIELPSRMPPSPSLISAPTLGPLFSAPLPLLHVGSYLTLLGSNTQHQVAPLQGLHSHAAQEATLVSLPCGDTFHIPVRPPSTQRPFSSLLGSDTHTAWLLTQMPSSRLSTTMVPQPYYRHQTCWAPCNGFWTDLCRKGREKNGKVEEEVADH